LDKRPVIVAIAGPNGAGKTTFFHSHLGEAGLRFINADDIARELKITSYEAAELADALRRELVRQRESFVFETVFSDPVRFGRSDSDSPDGSRFRQRRSCCSFPRSSRVPKRKIGLRRNPGSSVAARFTLKDVSRPKSWQEIERNYFQYPLTIQLKRRRTICRNFPICASARAI
jgi:hypothetical protein